MQEQLAMPTVQTDSTVLNARFSRPGACRREGSQHRSYRQGGHITAVRARQAHHQRQVNAPKNAPCLALQLAGVEIPQGVEKGVNPRPSRSGKITTVSIGANDAGR